MQSVVVIDYGVANLKNIVRGLEYVGASVNSTSNHLSIKKASRVVLPGVGSFRSGMKELSRIGLDDAVKDAAESGKPILGICLGMQMLLELSLEHGQHKGLGLIEGTVIPIPIEMEKGGKRKIPHVGWNALDVPKYRNDWRDSCLRKLQVGTFCYFSHSFTAIPDNKEDILAVIDYEEISLVGALRKNNLTGLQFHPELSGSVGLGILEQFVNA